MSLRASTAIACLLWLALAVLAAIASFAGFEHVSYLGYTSSLAFWSVLTLCGFGLGALAFRVGSTHGRHFRGAAGVMFGAPLLAYGIGGVGEVGTLLLYAPMILPVAMAMRRRTT